MNRSAALQAIGGTLIILVGAPLALLAILQLLGRPQGEEIFLILLFPLAVTAIGLVLLPVSSRARLLLGLLIIPLTIVGIALFTIGHACTYGDCL